MTVGKQKIKQQQKQPCVKIVVKELSGFSPFPARTPQSHGHGSGASERELATFSINFYPGVEDGIPYSSARGKLWHSSASPSATSGKGHAKCKDFCGWWDDVSSRHHCTGKNTQTPTTVNQHMILPMLLPAASGMTFSGVSQKTELLPTISQRFLVKEFTS